MLRSAPKAKRRTGVLVYQALKDWDKFMRVDL
jgi:hypothetical protein